jgi:hypothetical protein
MRNPTPLPPNGPITAADFASQRPGTVFPTLSRAPATYDSQEYHSLGAKGLQLFVDIDDVGAGPGTVTVSVLARNPANGEFVALPEAATTALNAAGQTVLTIRPGVEEDANATIAIALPHSFKIRAVVATNAVTFSVGGTLLP